MLDVRGYFMINISIDLESDLNDFLKEQLGFSSDNVEEHLRSFFNIEQKTIEQRPRVVSLSKELSQHPLFLNEKNDVIKNLIQKIEKGEDINVYLSHMRKNTRHYDTALIKLGVYHLHLGGKIEKRGSRKGLIKGTKSLLFAKVTESTIYFIDILNHDTTKGFLNRKLLNTLYKNWPLLLEEYRINDVKVKKSRFNNQEFSNLVSNNIDFSFQSEDGTQFFFPGLISTAGTDAKTEREIISVLNFIFNIENAILNNNKTILVEFIKLKSRIKCDILKFKLVYLNNKFCVQETDSKLLFFLGEKNEILSIEPSI